jgi:hypothetical protein
MTTMRTALRGFHVLAGLLASAGLATATAPPESGHENARVQIPLEIYTQLVAAAEPPTVAPAGFALGKADVNVEVTESEGRASATVRVALTIEVLEDRWVLVPILPAGTPVVSVEIDGKPVQLISTRGGLAWGVNKRGSYTMTLRYQVDATRSQAGFVLALPVPEAAATKLAATLPGAGLDVAVIPGAGVTSTTAGQHTKIAATIPATRGVQLSWRAPSLQSHTISRAFYAGKLVGDAIQWSGDLSVELVGGETVTLELLPRTVTLRDIEVDGVKAPIVVSGQSFATLVQGRGTHRLRILFQVPVQRSDGPPQVSLMIPEIPVSRFELTLPGRKEVTASPASDVAHRTLQKTTVASFHVPMTRHVQLSWTEAIPEDLRTETRANASLFHAIHAEEGVLYADVLVSYEVSRGELTAIELELPGDVQINRIASEGGGISDWRVTPGSGQRPQLVKVFLGHALAGEMRFRVYYDRSVANAGGPIPIPLIRARGVHRQRGMVALLATNEVALTPIEEENVTRVGENVLPSFFRRSIEKTIAHTFKYAEAVPVLVATSTTPERVLAKFDAEVNTLISLTDVTMKGSASVNVNVKSGELTEIQLALPPDVNLLNLTAPSLRRHRISDENQRLVTVEFTQGMEGQFRIELAYERITADAEAEVTVPTLRVVGAEVEQGRIAVEALAAVEVQVASAEQLSSLDPSELPQQLILKTTNPILLGYKYVHVDPPYSLVLRMTRHREVDVQTAAIDRADYRTLFTADGLAVTTASFTVRNSRKQFLRVQLPKGAELWSATVDGKPEKPAISNGSAGADGNGHAESSDHSGNGDTNGSGSSGHAPEILIKVINSVEGFPVELIYATPVSTMGRLGRVSATLPRPDMVVTRSRWDLYLPDRFRYGTATTNMDVVANGQQMNQQAMQAEMDAVNRASFAPQQLRPLHIEVPSSGIHYAFEKLYANQSEEDASFSIPYASDLGVALGQAVALTGTAIFWAGLYLAWRPAGPLTGPPALGMAAGGLILLLLPIGYLQTSLTPPLVFSLFALLGAGAIHYRASSAS